LLPDEPASAIVERTGGDGWRQERLDLGPLSADRLEGEALEVGEVEIHRAQRYAGLIGDLEGGGVGHPPVVEAEHGVDDGFPRALVAKDEAVTRAGRRRVPHVVILAHRARASIGSRRTAGWSQP